MSPDTKTHTEDSFRLTCFNNVSYVIVPTELKRLTDEASIRLGLTRDIKCGDAGVNEPNAMPLEFGKQINLVRNPIRKRGPGYQNRSKVIVIPDLVYATIEELPELGSTAVARL
jgi:hypothetical protein